MIRIKRGLPDLEANKKLIQQLEEELASKSGGKVEKTLEDVLFNDGKYYDRPNITE